MILSQGDFVTVISSQSSFVTVEISPPVKPTIQEHQQIRSSCAIVFNISNNNNNILRWKIDFFFREKLSDRKYAESAAGIRKHKVRERSFITRSFNCRAHHAITNFKGFRAENVQEPSLATTKTMR